MQLDLFEVSNWSYGLVRMNTGDVVLAEIVWDDKDNPIMWSEPNLVWEGDTPNHEIVRAIMAAAYDIQIEPDPISEIAFHTYSNGLKEV